ncbi:phosphoadenylyl-sulfate reductase [Aliamphritea ceti]|uniref:phosphoadenylyl-sulfate reductase n=1 Tax=Aliamphritea ceti TaxID=1524258 RepID=UPI0021C3645D|nr:phosphoadenylyl-sulfate reductase [Aliamphritea ceti]
MSDSISPQLAAKVEHSVSVLQQAASEYGSGVVFANSLGAEDVVITDLLQRANTGIASFVLDTGRLPEETLTLLEAVQQRYPELPVKVYYPLAEQVETYVANHGVNAFYRSQTLRKSCCAVRKLEPLKRALAGNSAWITGLRREQSVTREEVGFKEYDAGNAMDKFNPLADWTDADVWAYIRAYDVPYNQLHDKNFPSIGCAPCTRAVSQGEDIRAGRWWWENPETRECGLHPGTPAQTVAETSKGVADFLPG